ncbi:MAG: hypothetical protein Q9213_007048 [Squamulea squamosa]
MTSSQNGISKPNSSPTPDISFQSTTSPESEDASSSSTSASPTNWKKALDIIFYTPKRCRYDPANPPRFTIWLNLLFAFAGAFTVANLYYNHPILHLLAEEFDVSNERASLIPTLAQAVLPLVGDLAPSHRRATALSVVSSGLLLGLLFARLLSGVVTEYTAWRNIYWLSFGLQYLIFALLWFFMPDYPSTNPDGINYFRILYSILQIFINHPLLVQACLVGFCTSTTFTSFWTTLTFLLSAPPYEYSTLIIGLFALIGIASMFLGPVWSRFVTDRFIPLFSVILGLFICLAGTCIGTYTGTFTVVGPIIQAFFLDFGIQTAMIANRSAIYSILPKARNRVNTAYMISAFCGQLTGTAVGNHIFAIGGWTSSGSTSVGFLVMALLLCVVRGPRETRWVGWSGGWQIRKAGDVARKEDEEKGKKDTGEEVSAETSQDISQNGEQETNVDVDIDLTKVEKSDNLSTSGK